MKKFSLMLILIICLVMVPQPDPFDDVVVAFGGESEYEIYFVGTIVDELPSDVTFVKNGAGTIVFGTASQIAEIKSCIVGEIYGETIRIMGVYENIEEVIQTLNIEIVKREDFEDIQCVYGNIIGLENYVTINSKQVNIQIVYSNDTISIGYPLIIGAY